MSFTASDHSTLIWLRILSVCSSSHLWLAKIHPRSIRQILEDLCQSKSVVIKKTMIVIKTTKAGMEHLLMAFTHCACSPSGGGGWWSSPETCDQQSHRNAEPSNWACCHSASFLREHGADRTEDEGTTADTFTCVIKKDPVFSVIGSMFWNLLPDIITWSEFPHQNFSAETRSDWIRGSTWV